MLMLRDSSIHLWVSIPADVLLYLIPLTGNRLVDNARKVFGDITGKEGDEIITNVRFAVDIL
jgi:hypothetical protein